MNIILCRYKQYEMLLSKNDRCRGLNPLFQLLACFSGGQKGRSFGGNRGCIYHPSSNFCWPYQPIKSYKTISAGVSCCFPHWMKCCSKSSTFQLVQMWQATSSPSAPGGLEMGLAGERPGRRSWRGSNQQVRAPRWEAGRGQGCTRKRGFLKTGECRECPKKPWASIV